MTDGSCSQTFQKRDQNGEGLPSIHQTYKYTYTERLVFPSKLRDKFSIISPSYLVSWLCGFLTLLLFVAAKSSPSCLKHSRLPGLVCVSEFESCQTTWQPERSRDKNADAWHQLPRYWVTPCTRIQTLSQPGGVTSTASAFHSHPQGIAGCHGKTEGLSWSLVWLAQQREDHILRDFAKVYLAYARQTTQKTAPNRLNVRRRKDTGKLLAILKIRKTCPSPGQPKRPPSFSLECSSQTHVSCEDQLCLPVWNPSNSA